MSEEQQGGMTPQEVRNIIGKPKEITLPSGAKFLIKKVTARDIITQGITEIPNQFQPYTEDGKDGQEPKKEPNAEEMQKNLEIMNKFIVICVETGCINPPVMMTYDEAKKDSHVLYGELDKADQEVLVQAIIGK